LDAFFEEVSEVEAKVEEEEEEEEQEPPKKKAKTTSTAPVLPPRGVVVAAASTVRKNKDEVEESGHLSKKTVVGPTMGPTVPPPPPPPPPQQSPSSNNNPPLPPHPPPQQSKPHVRTAAGKTWVDSTLADWPDNDFRIFVGNMANDVTDQMLYDHFAKYPSMQRVKIVRDKQGTSKGYGFVSLQNAIECAKAIREMDQTWLGSRPIRIKRSTWKDREVKQVRKKQRQKH